MFSSDVVTQIILILIHSNPKSRKNYTKMSQSTYQVEAILNILIYAFQSYFFPKRPVLSLKIN